MAKQALGKGLGALLGNPQKPGRTEIPQSRGRTKTQSAAVPPSSETSGALTLPISEIHASALQPRKEFAESAIRELAQSIKRQGIIQPLVVRRSDAGYELIAGERRLRASQLAGLSEVPAIIKEADDSNTLRMMLIENLQREDLNPIEEAKAYAQLVDAFGLKQDDVGKQVGKSRTAVANAIRLLKLPEEVQSKLATKDLSVGQAKVILGLENPDAQQAAADHVITKGLNVRETESYIADLQGGKVKLPKRKRTPPQTTGHSLSSNHILEIETKLREKLGTKVALAYRDGSGKLEIALYSDNDLQRLMDLLQITLD